MSAAKNKGGTILHKETQRISQAASKLDTSFDPEYGKGFGGVLREERERAGVSVRQLAAKMDFSPTYMSAVERGVRAPLGRDKLLLLGVALHPKDGTEATRVAMKLRRLLLHHEVKEMMGGCEGDNVMCARVANLIWATTED